MIPLRWEWIAAGYFTYLLIVALGDGRFIRARVAALVGTVLCSAVIAAQISGRLVPGMDAVAFAILGPLVILLSGYWLSGLFFVNPMQHTERWLMTVDDWLLRRSGILAAYQASPRIVSELVEAAYVLVYLVIPAGAATLVIGGHPDAINRFWATVLLAAFLSYGTMPWLRTRSPRVLEAAMGTMHPRSSVRRLNAAILDRASIQANTVPSGHAASAVATALAVVSVMPLAGSIFLALAGAIVIATVLGRYHYLVDSLLGIIVAVAAWQLCR